MFGKKNQSLRDKMQPKNRIWKQMHKAKRQREQLLVVLQETKHHSLELCISGRANLAKVLQEFCAEVQLENVSL